MKPMDISRRAAAVLVIAMLAACGGGGGGGGGGDTGGGGGGGDGGGGGGGGGSNPGTPVAVTGQYRLQPAATDFNGALTAMNAQGAQGYAFLSSFFPSGNASTFGDFYVSDTAHASSRLDYAMEPVVATADAALAQMNARGAQGYAYKAGAAYGTTMPIEQRSIYVKDTSRSVTYSYERLASTTKATYEAQLNAQGARGYRIVGPMIVGGEQFNLYSKDNSGATYSYSLRDWVGNFGVADGAALQQQLTEMGAQGYMYQGGMALQGQTVVQFEKSSAQNGAVEYQVEQSTQTTLDGMLARMNERAAQGFFLFSDVIANDGKTYTISVKNAVALRHPLAGISFP